MQSRPVFLKAFVKWSSIELVYLQWIGSFHMSNGYDHSIFIKHNLWNARAESPDSKLLAILSDALA